MANKDQKNPNNSNNPAGASVKDLEFEAEVLFQRIYDKWYAFSVVDEDCLVTEVTEEEITLRKNALKAMKRAA